MGMRRAGLGQQAQRQLWDRPTSMFIGSFQQALIQKILRAAHWSPYLSLEAPSSGVCGEREHGHNAKENLPTKERHTAGSPPPSGGLQCSLQPHFWSKQTRAPPGKAAQGIGLRTDSTAW